MTLTRVLAQATVSDLDRAVIWYAAATATPPCPHRPPGPLTGEPDGLPHPDFPYDDRLDGLLPQC
jgi:hypothetical protein